MIACTAAQDGEWAHFVRSVCDRLDCGFIVNGIDQDTRACGRFFSVLVQWQRASSHHERRTELTRYLPVRIEKRAVPKFHAQKPPKQVPMVRCTSVVFVQESLDVLDVE